MSPGLIGAVNSRWFRVCPLREKCTFDDVLFNENWLLNLLLQEVTASCVPLRYNLNFAASFIIVEDTKRIEHFDTPCNRVNVKRVETFFERTVLRCPARRPYGRKLSAIFHMATSDCHELSLLSSTPGSRVNLVMSGFFFFEKVNRLRYSSVSYILNLDLERAAKSVFWVVVGI